jgi:hypothetical protein
MVIVIGFCVGVRHEIFTFSPLEAKSLFFDIGSRDCLSRLTKQVFGLARFEYLRPENIYGFAIHPIALSRLTLTVKATVRLAQFVFSQSSIQSRPCLKGRVLGFLQCRKMGCRFAGKKSVRQGDLIDMPHRFVLLKRGVEIKDHRQIGAFMRT